MAWTGKWTGGRIWTAKDGKKTYYIWKMVDGRRYNVSTKTNSERDAYRHLDIFDRDPKAYMEGKDTVPLTQDLLDEYVKHLEEKERSKGHVRRAKYFIGDLKDDLNGGDLKKVTRSDLLKALEGKSSRDMRIALFKSFWTWLEDERGFESNPTRKMKVKPSKPAQWTKSKVISDADHEKVVEALRLLDKTATGGRPSTNGNLYADILIVLAGTGWHVSEVMKLHEIKMLRDTGAHREKWVEKNPFVLVTKHKSGDIHQTLVGRNVMEAALRILALKQDGQMFNNVAAFYRALQKACKDVGIKPFTPGRYRHTIASRAIEAGVPVEKVSAFLGHKSATTTKRFYATHAIRPKIPTLE